MKTKMIHWLLTLLAVLSVSSTLHASETVTFFHHDALGSTIAATDENGDTLWTEEYTPYGNRIEQAGDGTNALWYTGKEEELGLNYSLARWYDPKVGRFLSIDPVNFDESNLQSFNRYAYANNNPYKYSDPDGNSPKLVLDFALNVTINILTTGQPGLVSAAVDTATNVFNPAATATKFKKLHSLYQKVDGNVTNSVKVSRSKHPETAKHIEDAQAAGHPQTLTINRAGTAANRKASLQGVPTKKGYDRDEYPPAMFKEGGSGASVRHISPGDNRGAGSSIGAQCRGLACGTKVTIDVVD